MDERQMSPLEASRISAEEILAFTERTLSMKPTSEKVVHPKHYTKGIECWDYTTSHDMGFLDGNVVKYVTRYKYKDGLQDLKKAKQYLEKLIQVETERLNADPNSTIEAGPGISPGTR